MMYIRLQSMTIITWMTIIMWLHPTTNPHGFFLSHSQLACILSAQEALAEHLSRLGDPVLSSWSMAKAV